MISLIKNTEAERYILSCVFQDSRLIPQITSLDESYFTLECTNIIFNAILKLQSNTDVVSVTKYCLETNQNITPNEIMEIIEYAPITAHFDYYKERLIDARNRREIVNHANSLIKNAVNDETDIVELIGSELTKMMDGIKTNNKQSFIAFSDVVMQNINEQQQISEERKQMYIPTTYKDIDQKITGFKPGDLIIIGARPAVGKSAFAVNLALRCAKNSDRPVMYYSLEMRNNEHVYRMMASLLGVDSTVLKNGVFYAEDNKQGFKTLDSVYQSSKKYNILFNDNFSFSIEDIKTTALEAKIKHNPKLIIIDYLQLISSKNKNNMYEKTTELTRSLKLLANELQLPIIVLSQLSRKVEERDGKPHNSDLRDSGSIEQDADKVMLLYYKNEKEKEATEGLLHVLISKCRDGSCGEVDLFYDKKSSRILSVEYSE